MKSAKREAKSAPTPAKFTGSRLHRVKAASTAQIPPITPRGDHARVSEFGCRGPKTPTRRRRKKNIRIHDASQEFLAGGKLKFVHAGNSRGKVLTVFAVQSV